MLVSEQLQCTLVHPSIAEVDLVSHVQIHTGTFVVAFAGRLLVSSGKSPCLSHYGWGKYGRKDG